MRTTVNLDQDIYEIALQRSRVSGRRLGKVLSDMARQGLNGEKKFKFKRKGRFPVFDVPAGTPPMTMESIQRALEDEDY